MQTCLVRTIGIRVDIFNSLCRRNLGNYFKHKDKVRIPRRLQTITLASNRLPPSILTNSMSTLIEDPQELKF